MFGATALSWIRSNGDSSSAPRPTSAINARSCLVQLSGITLNPDPLFDASDQGRDPVLWIWATYHMSLTRPQPPQTTSSRILNSLLPQSMSNASSLFLRPQVCQYHFPHLVFLFRRCQLITRQPRLSTSRNSLMDVQPNLYHYHSNCTFNLLPEENSDLHVAVLNWWACEVPFFSFW